MLTPHLVQYFLQLTLRNKDMVGYHRLIVFPPTAEGKGLGSLMAIYVKGDGKLSTKLRLDPKQFQHMSVGSGLVRALLR